MQDPAGHEGFTRQLVRAAFARQGRLWPERESVSALLGIEVDLQETHRAILVEATLDSALLEFG